MKDVKSTYVSGSPGKKVARFFTWVAMENLAKRLGTQAERCLVLAGHGGDISLGDLLHNDKVTAVDLDLELVEFCREKFPWVDVRHGNVVDVAKDIDFNFVHLDFCNGLCLQNIRTIRDVIMEMSLPGVVAVTLMKGREAKEQIKGDLRPPINGQIRRALHSIRRKAGHGPGLQMLKGRTFDPALEIERSRVHMRKCAKRDMGIDILKAGKMGSMDTAIVRAYALSRSVDALTEGTDRVLGMPISTMGYLSKSEISRGVPMFSTVMPLMLRTGTEEFEEFSLSLLDEKRFGNLTAALSGKGRDAEEELRSQVLKVMQSREDGGGELTPIIAARAFNMPVGIVRAWKAVETRQNRETTLKEVS